VDGSVTVAREEQQAKAYAWIDVTDGGIRMVDREEQP